MLIRYAKRVWEYVRRRSWPACDDDTCVLLFFLCVFRCCWTGGEMIYGPHLLCTFIHIFRRMHFQNINNSERIKLEPGPVESV